MSVGNEGYGPVLKLVALGLFISIFKDIQSSPDVINAPASLNLLTTESTELGLVPFIFISPPVIATAVK